MNTEKSWPRRHENTKNKMKEFLLRDFVRFVASLLIS